MSPFPLVSTRIMITWKSKDKSFNKLWSWARVRKNYLRNEWQARESAPGSSLPPLPGPQSWGRGEHCPGRGRPRPQGLEGAPGARAEGEPEQLGRWVPQAGRADGGLCLWRPHLTCGCRIESGSPSGGGRHQRATVPGCRLTTLASPS